MKHVDFEGKEHADVHCEDCWEDSLRVRQIVALERIADSLGRLVRVDDDTDLIVKPEPKPYRPPIVPAVKVPEIHRRPL